MMSKEKPAEKNNDETCGNEAEKSRTEESGQEEQLHKLIRELGKKNEKEKENYKRKKPRK